MSSIRLPAMIYYPVLHCGRMDKVTRRLQQLELLQTRRLTLVQGSENTANCPCAYVTY